MNSEQITAFLQEHWYIASVLIGAVILIGAIRNWNWLCDPTGTRDAHRHSRGYRRVVFFYEALPSWCNPQKTLLQRWNSFHSPLGCNPKEFFIFEFRHYGFLRAYFHYMTIHIRLLFPQLWKTRKI